MVTVDPGDTILAVKEKIQKRENIPIEQQNLIFSGVKLDDDKLLNSYNVQRDSTVHLVIKVKTDDRAADEGQKPREERSQAHSNTSAKQPSYHTLSSGGSSEGYSGATYASQRSDETNYQPYKYSDAGRMEQPRRNYSGQQDAYRGRPDDPSSQPPTDRRSGSHSYYNPPTMVPLSHSSHSREESMTLNIDVRSGKRFTVTVSTMESVRGLKNQIYQQERIKPEEQTLLFSGRQLQDGRTLNDYMISNNCTVHLNVTVAAVQLHLFVKTLTGKTHILYPMSTQTIMGLKRELQQREGVDASKLTLLFEGSSLDDDKALKDCNLPQQCTLHVVQKKSSAQKRVPNIPILVHTLSGKTITIMASTEEKVMDIKQKIQAKEGYPMERINLLFGGNKLENDAIIGECNILASSTLLLTLQPKEDMIAVSIHNTINEEVVNLPEVNASNRVYELLEMLQGKVIIPTPLLTLVYKGRALQLDATLKDSNVVKNSILYLYADLPSSVLVSVRTVAGKECSFEVGVVEMVSSLKGKVQECWGIQKNDQMLLYNGEALEDERSLSSYNITSDKISLVLFVVSVNWFEVTIELPTTRMAVKATHDFTVAALKAQVSEQQGIPGNLLSLHRNGMCLEDHFTLGDYLIRERDLITVAVHHSPVIVVHVQTADSKSFTLSLDAEDTMEYVRVLVASKCKVPTRRIELFYAGYPLSMNSTATDCNLSNPCTIFVEITSGNRPF